MTEIKKSSKAEISNIYVCIYIYIYYAKIISAKYLALSVLVIKTKRVFDRTETRIRYRDNTCSQIFVVEDSLMTLSKTDKEIR